MTSINDASKAFTDILQSIYEMLISSQSLDVSLDEKHQQQYNILSAQKSVPSWILFVQSQSSNGSLVIKLLSDYQDARYDLSSVEKRLYCQLEALKWNSKFSPGIYYGLASVRSLSVSQKSIILGPIVHHFFGGKPDGNVNYALVMRPLPPERRLDVLLMNAQSAASLQEHLLKIVRRIIQIHASTEPLSYEESVQWGGYDQLRRKLELNLALADPILSNNEDKQYMYPDSFREAFISLKNKFLQHFSWNNYQVYFEQRIQGKHIKHCHGDLKAPNIWLEESSGCSEESVFILDAIDFNDMYCNIDTLRDFAMLIIDIQTRTGNLDIGEELLDEYLQYTNQDDSISRLVAYYYLFEKAYICAAISLIYDANPELCKSYLPIAQVWLDKLLEQK